MYVYAITMCSFLCLLVELLSILERKLADTIAALGFYVVAPDFFYGEPFDRNRPVQDWLKDHGPVFYIALSSIPANCLCFCCIVEPTYLKPGKCCHRTRGLKMQN